jgi:regulator of cell morphogenesis and NO signaling
MASRSIAQQTLQGLISHILDTHHAYLRRELPRLEAIVARMSANHGQERPELFQIQQLLQDLRDDLSAHLLKEEQILFPHVARLERSVESLEPPPAACFASVQFPIRMMHMEHDRAQDLLRDLRSATSNYTPPTSVACECAASFYKGLAELESDLLEHIRVENEELFPRAIALEEELLVCR